MSIVVKWGSDMLKNKSVIGLVFMVMCMPSKGMENQRIKVKTTDKKFVRMSQSVLENSTLLYKQYGHKKAKKIENIIVFAPVDRASMALFENGIMSLKAPSDGFKKYYEEIENKGLLRQLINVAGALESGELTAHLVRNFFPTDMSEYIASFVMHSATEALRYKIIEKNCGHSLKTACSINVDLTLFPNKMISCKCERLAKNQKVLNLYQK